MIKVYNWNDTTLEGVWLDDYAYTDMHCLKVLIESLKNHDTYVIAYDKNQLIIGDKHYMEVDRMSERVNHNTTELDLLKGRVGINEVHIQDLGYDIEDLKINFPSTDEPSREEVTEDFFLLADMLPANIRKELKIYIKNDTRR